eukprot:1161396-Pelagomonas_calceolata.AAC.2
MHIHADELMKAVTGSPLNPQFFLEYLNKKYTDFSRRYAASRRGSGVLWSCSAERFQGKERKGKATHGYILGANTLTTNSPPRGLDPGTTSVSGGSQGCTVYLTMQDPQSPVFSGTPGRGAFEVICSQKKARQAVETLPTSVKEKRMPRAKALCIPFTKRSKKKKSMGIRRVASSSSSILVIRVERSLLKSASVANKFISVLDRMSAASS